MNDSPLHSPTMRSDSRIYIAGHRGLVGSAILRFLRNAGYANLLVATRQELELKERDAVLKYFDRERPEFVVLAAARVGGIAANQASPVEFLRDNLLIQANVIDACFATGIGRLLFLGSSCIYPRDCSQPIREEYFMTGPLESSNRAYAIAKIAGIEQCWAYNRQYGTSYLAAMPTNLYGPGDNYDLQTSHVLPALMRKVAIAKARHERHIAVWGSGRPRREFLYSDDLAEACVLLLSLSENEFQKLLPGDRAPLVNIGSGSDVTISELAQTICEVMEYEGQIEFDASQPDGTPRKLLDVSRIHSLGWRPRISLRQGIRKVAADLPPIDLKP